MFIVIQKQNGIWGFVAKSNDGGLRITYDGNSAAMTPDKTTAKAWKQWACTYVGGRATIVRVLKIERG